MAWITQPMQIADQNGEATGKWRMTTTSDEDGGGPYGNPTCYHDSPQEAMECDECDEYTAKWSPRLSRKERQRREDKRDRDEYERLKAKFELDGE